jgi:hypothetical protein
MQLLEAFNPLIRLGLRKDFRTSYDSDADEYSQFLKVSSTTEPELMAAVFTGLSRLYELRDSESVSYESPKLSSVVAAVDREFGLGVAISKKLQEDEKYGLMRQSAQWLAHATRMCYEYRSAELLDDAFTGSTFKGVDGLSLINASHTYLNNGASTWSNTTSNPVQMSVTGVTALMDVFMGLKDHNGDPIKSWFDKVVVSNNATDYNAAMQIFRSEKEPFTTENQDNAIKMRAGGTKLVISRFKQDANSYFAIDSRLNDANFVMRRKATYEDSKDFNTGAILAKVTTRFILWFVDARGWAGIDPS